MNMVNESDLVMTNQHNFSLDAFEINGKMVDPDREEFYTSYPFFKYWKNTSNDKLLSVDAGINIYIHIPFCIQICDYCFYMKEQIKSKDEVDDYIEKLCMEIEMVSDRHNLRKRKVNSVYIGGGTPSVLSEKQFKRLVEALHKFHSMSDTEFTFEAEPGTFSGAKLNWYKESGVNRISMGVQSFEDDIIKLSHRKHTAQQAINSINMIKDTGGFSVNIDLLSGLAGETMETWERSTDVAFAQNIDMLTIYKMKTYANTTFYKKGVHGNAITLPSQQEDEKFMSRAFEKVREHGFQLWSTYSFTRNNYMHRFTENTLRNHDLIAYGASSYGKLGTVNYQNVNSIKAYMEKVSANVVPVSRTYKLSVKDMIVKEILLCSRLGSYSNQEFIDKFGFDYFKLIPDVISELIEKSYLVDDLTNLRFTDKGLLYSDFVSRILASSVKNVLGTDAIGFIY